MPSCKYGDKCYRKNEDHIKEFHSHKTKKEEEVKEKEEVKKESPESSQEKVTKKRKADEEFVEEKNTQKREAKIKKVVKEEKEEDINEYETVEEIVETEATTDENTHVSSPSKRGLPVVLPPHRTPFPPQPQSIYSLWKKATEHDQNNPRAAFSEVNGLRLVGFFDFLAGELKEATDDEIRIHARYATDLPEMQTIMVTSTGRYALWRDDPKHSTSLVVYAKHDDEHFTKITMVGDKPIHALVHAAGEGAEAMLDKFYPMSSNGWAIAAKLKQEAKAAIAKRTKSSIGRPLHSMRLWVHVDQNDVGYRSIGEDLNKMKRTMTLIGESTDEVVRKKKMSELREIGTNVQLANDECDFGTGLEFGHDLFIANYPNLDAMAKRYLSMAYQLLGRVEFGAIVDAHMEEGVRRRKNVMINQ